MNIASIILDISVIGILLIMFIWAKNKGFIRSAIDLLGVGASAVLSYMFCGRVGEMIFNVFAKDRIIATVTQVIEENGAAQSISKAISSAMSLIGGSDVSKSVESVIKANGTADVKTLATAIADGAITPVVMPLISGIAFILMFIICVIVIKIIARIISRGIRHIPLIGPLDSLLGGFVGIAEGCLLIVVAAMIINVLPVVIGGAPVVTQGDIDATYIFKYFYNFIRIY